METFSTFLALCAGNSPVSGESPEQTPLTRSFGVFFDLRLNKRSSKQSRRRWFETPLCPLWRHCNVWTGQWHVHSRVSSVPIHVWEIYTLLMIMLTDIFQNSSRVYRLGFFLLFLTFSTGMAASHPSLLFLGVRCSRAGPYFIIKTVFPGIPFIEKRRFCTHRYISTYPCMLWIINMTVIYSGYKIDFK